MRFLIGASASSLVLLLFAAGVQYSIAHPAGPAWTVRRTTTAQHMLVVDVDARASADLQAIGTAIVTPAQTRFDEILIYVRSGKTTLRRIQWTRQHGFVELVISG